MIMFDIKKMKLPRDRSNPENNLYFDVFFKVLKELETPIDYKDFRENREKITFHFEGARNSIILYTIKDGRIKGWFGKSDNESGGMYAEATISDEKGLRRLLQFHKRFMISGRRKVLRNYRG